MFCAPQTWPAVQSRWVIYTTRGDIFVSSMAVGRVHASTRRHPIEVLGWVCGSWLLADCGREDKGSKVATRSGVRMREVIKLCW